MFSTKSKNLLLGKWRIDGRGNESNCSLSLSFIDEMELVQLLLSLLITSYLYVYIFHLGEIRDCRQIAFVTLNRFCMFKQKNRPPLLFLNGQYQDNMAWNITQNGIKNIYLFILYLPIPFSYCISSISMLPCLKYVER